jgi:hypothetical protein
VRVNNRPATVVGVAPGDSPVWRWTTHGSGY